MNILVETMHLYSSKRSATHGTMGRSTTATYKVIFCQLTMARVGTVGIIEHVGLFVLLFRDLIGSLLNGGESYSQERSSDCRDFGRP